LYGLLGLSRENKEGIRAQHGRNYQFFDAPVGLIFTMDRVMEQGSWLDYGMFLQNIMIAARGRGLDTCPQAAFTQYHKIISDMLHIPESQRVMCGMSIGYADPDKIENTLATEREPVSGFTKFLD
jgi:nitroreductase